VEIILKGIESSLDCVFSNIKDLFIFKKNSRKYSFHNNCDVTIVQLEFKKHEAQRKDRLWDGGRTFSGVATPFHNIPFWSRAKPKEL
jgi:hypothetical protein